MRRKLFFSCSAYPDLHKTIADLATASAGADSRMCTDVFYACKKLDDLHAAL